MITTIHTTYLMENGEVKHFTDVVDKEINTSNVSANIFHDVQHATMFDQKIMIAQVLVVPNDVTKDAYSVLWSDNSRQVSEVA